MRYRFVEPTSFLLPGGRGSVDNANILNFSLAINGRSSLARDFAAGAVKVTA
jgi:hypothetical protein